MSREHRVARPIAVGSTLAIALLIASTPLPGLAHAGPKDSAIVVTTFADSLAADGKCSLREAVRAANLDLGVDGCRAGRGADTIKLAAGLYRLAIEGRGEDASLQGDLDVTGDLDIRGAGRYRTTIDAWGIDRVLDVHGRSRLRLSSLTIAGGRIPYTDSGPWDGGGILSEGRLVLRDVVVTGNHASADGGGIASRGTLSMTDCTVTKNDSGPNSGGGGGILTTGSAHLTRVTISENLSASSGARDEAAAGIAATGYLLLERSLVTRNHGSGEWTPGGISVRDGVIVETTISNNTGGSIGTGGVVMTHSRMISSTVSGNAGGGDGGAGGVLAIDSTISNSTISGNQAGGVYGTGGPWANAGGIYAIGSRIESSTITGNTSVGIPGSPVSPAGGVEAEAGTHVLGSVIAGNRGATGSGQDCGGTIVSDGYNLVRNVSHCSLQTAHGDIIGRDPLLRPLADNGGPTLTHSLRAGSPAVDAWPDSHGRSWAGCPAFDQRGVRRPQEGDGRGRTACDIGSVEMTRAR